MVAEEARGDLWSTLSRRLGLTPRRERAVKQTLAKKRRWRLVQVESSMACNLRCVMCPWKAFREEVCNQGLMSQEIWEGVRPHLPEIASVDFTGGGEPLMQPRLVEWVSETHAAGCETGILSNGLLLRKELALRLIDAGLDWLCVSMDGADKELYEQIRPGSNFERVCENLGNVAHLRSNSIPKTMINFVMMRLNFHQVQDMVKLAARLGVDQINFRQCEVIRGEHGKGFGLFRSEETEQIRRYKKELSKAVSLAGKLGVEAITFSFTPRERPVCEQDPRDELFVRYDGQVAPCINLAMGGPTMLIDREVVLPTVYYGRIPEQDLLELWETETCRYYREIFESRAKVYEQTFVAGMMGDSRKTADKLHEEAVKRMPQAAEGCRICHYLYDV
ncbi:MAG: radical SAM protein [Thermodesulfobacteriota bacterium]